MNNAVTIVRVSLNDANTLLELSRKTFFDAFLSTNNPADMEAYASTAFTLPKFQFELINPNSAFYFALVDNEIAGYIKLNYVDAQTELQDPDALEIERIYVLNDFQGQQIGKQLINLAIQTAVDKNLKYIWLGVWEHNTKAIKFYRSKGFEQFGSHPFMLGSDKQTDILMKKEL
ncbi:GNAT family N-acetyltransferase [Mucilaginibacter phyllosphaerae]